MSARIIAVSTPLLPIANTAREAARCCAAAVTAGVSRAASQHDAAVRYLWAFLSLACICSSARYAGLEAGTLPPLKTIAQTVQVREF